MSLAELAERHGLSPSSARPSLFAYVGQLWRRRHFIRSYSTSHAVAAYSRSLLGQAWQVITPLLNAGVYLLIFGIVLGTNRGIPNFIIFLVTGVFVFTYTQRSVTSSARAISGNLSLIRALHFPRAALPLSSTLIELRQLLVSMVVLIALVLVIPVNMIGSAPAESPEPITWHWLLVIPTLLLQTMFNIGLGFIIARLGARFTDIQQLLPFALRVWLYASGVIFSIPDRFGPKVPDWALDLVMANPTAVYIELVRSSLMESHDLTSVSFTWLLAVGWAVVFFVGGFIYFWSAEEQYGRG